MPAFKKIIVTGISLSIAFMALPAGAAQDGATASGKQIVLQQAAGGDVRWILPGPRRLDPTVFGTPANPFGFEDDIGVPVKARLLNDDGTAFTTTAGPTPMSDRHAPATGSFRATLTDNSPVDSRASRDSVEGVFTFTDPKGVNEYRVVLRRSLPMGPVHQFFGGVLIDGFHHGKTAFGTRLQPTAYTYGAAWAVADLYINGEKVSENRMVHLMTTERVRSSDADGYRLLIDGELTRTGIQTHLLLPNMVITPEGPRMKPVPSGFILPNGVEQPFIHIMFDDTELEGLPVL